MIWNGVSWMRSACLDASSSTSLDLTSTLSTAPTTHGQSPVATTYAMPVHQCLNGLAPPCLSEHCIPVSSAADTRRHLRSANRHAVPRFRLDTYGRRAFSVAGPMAWNSLPDFIRDPTSSTDSFRRLLKTYLFARY